MYQDCKGVRKGVGTYVVAQPSPSTFSPTREDSAPAKLQTPSGATDPELARGYRKRNVCKAILRRICQRIKSDREGILQVLYDAGYRDDSLKSALGELLVFYNTKRQKEISEHAHRVIEKLVETRTVYTFILKDTIGKMLEDWAEGNNGKIGESNIDYYKIVSRYYYEKALKIINN